MPTSRAAWGAAAAAAVGAAVLVAALARRPPPARLPLEGVPPAAVVRLERTLGGETLMLEKRGGRWSSGGREAAAAPCDALARGAAALALGPKAADDASAFDRFGLDDASAARLRVFVEGAPGAALDAYFGAPVYGDSLYARMAGESAIYVETGLAPETLLAPATAFIQPR